MRDKYVDYNRVIDPFSGKVLPDILSNIKPGTKYAAIDPDVYFVQTETTGVRGKYLRISGTGSNAHNLFNFIEFEAYSYGVNVARGILPTTITGLSLRRPASMTDGQTTQGYYDQGFDQDITEDLPGVILLEFDKSYLFQKFNLYMYFMDGCATYYNVKLEISSDGTNWAEVMPAKNITSSMGYPYTLNVGDNGRDYVEVPYTDIPMTDLMDVNVVPNQQIGIIEQYTSSSKYYINGYYIYTGGGNAWSVNAGCKSYCLPIPEGATEVHLTVPTSGWGWTMQYALYDYSFWESTNARGYQYYKQTEAGNLDVIIPINGHKWLGICVELNLTPQKITVDYTMGNLYKAKFPNWVPSYNDLLNRIIALENKHKGKLIRYIRSSMEGGSTNPSYPNNSIWTEIKALTAGGNNVALNKVVSTTGQKPTIGTLNKIVDGNINIEGLDDNICAWSDKNYHEINIDLGEVYEIYELQWWQYFTANISANRGFYNLKYEVSQDGLKWETIFDSNLNGEYVDDILGNSIRFT